MKSFAACLVVAFGLLHSTSADSIPCVFDTSAGVTGAVKVVSNLCANVVANLGIVGCTNVLQGFIGGSANLICYAEIKAYVNNFIDVLVGAKVVTQGADGLLVFVGTAASIDITAFLEASAGVGLSVGADLVVALKGAVSGCLIGGLIGGLSANVGVAVNALNVLWGLIAQVTKAVGCVKTCPAA